MKKHINLILQRQASNSITIWLQRIRKYALVLSVISFMVLIVQLFIFSYLNQSIQKYEQNKTVLSQYLIQNKGLEQKIEYFLYKYNLLKSYLGDDAEAYTYYNLLQTILAGLNINGELSQFTINRNKLAIFTVRFSTYEDALVFIDLIETPQFLNYFETLQLNNFTLGTANSNYELVFNGQFKELTNEN